MGLLCIIGFSLSTHFKFEWGAENNSFTFYWMDAKWVDNLCLKFLFLNVILINSYSCWHSFYGVSKVSNRLCMYNSWWLVPLNLLVKMEDPFSWLVNFGHCLINMQGMLRTAVRLMPYTRSDNRLLNRWTCGCLSAKIKAKVPFKHFNWR